VAPREDRLEQLAAHVARRRVRGHHRELHRAFDSTQLQPLEPGGIGRSNTLGPASH